MKTIHYEDLFYSVKIKPSEFSVDFEVYEIEGWCSLGNHTYYDNIWDLDEAKPLFTGSIKWDHCSNWDVPRTEGCTHQFHFCGMEQAINLGKLMERLYKIAEEELSQNWLKD